MSFEQWWREQACKNAYTVKEYVEKGFTLHQVKRIAEMAFIQGKIEGIEETKNIKQELFEDARQIIAEIMATKDK